MKLDEWETICLLIEEAWPGEFEDRTAKAWRVFLDDYGAAQVLAALKGMVARGGTFRPSVAEVVAEIRRDPSAPTFDEAWQLIRLVLAARTQVRKAVWEQGERAMLNEQAMLERAQQPDIHPLVGSFVARQGGPLRLQALGLDDSENEYREARRHELRDRWGEHCEAMEGREVRALASGRRGELGRLDPLAALGGPAAQIGSGSK